MLLFEFLFVLILALTLTTIFALGFRRYTTVSMLLPFFTILFLATWATGIWITPVGPMIRGFYWMPFLIVGIFYAVLLSALIPPSHPPRSLREEVRQKKKEEATLLALNSFFWILVGGLLVAIIARYIFFQL